MSSCHAFRLGRLDPNSLVSTLDKYLMDKIVRPIECEEMIEKIRDLESLIDAESLFLMMEHFYTGDFLRPRERERIYDKSRENLAEYKERLNQLRVILRRQHVALATTNCSDLV